MGDNQWWGNENEISQSRNSLHKGSGKPEFFCYVISIKAACEVPHTQPAKPLQRQESPCPRPGAQWSNRTPPSPSAEKAGQPHSSPVPVEGKLSKGHGGHRGHCVPATGADIHTLLPTASWGQPPQGTSPMCTRLVKQRKEPALHGWPGALCCPHFK